MDFFYGEMDSGGTKIKGYRDNVYNDDPNASPQIKGKLAECGEIDGNLQKIYNDNPEESTYIYGKLVKEVAGIETVTYDGLATETATTIIDNTDKTIKVNVNTDVIATKEYVDVNGGKIDNILLNDEIQPIQDIIIDGVEYKKAVNLTDVATTSDLAEKQDTLIAGDNITIEDNVISASGASLSTVVLEEDLYTYANVGNITTASPLNAIKIAEQGDNLSDVWEVLFGQKDEQPVITSYPTLSLSFSNYGGNSQEYGRKITSLQFTLGKTTGGYTYDTTTGVNWLNDPIFTLNGNELNYTNNILEINYTVGINTTFNIYATQGYSEGNIATTLLGNESNPIVRIPAGTATTNRNFSVTSVKYAYYGVNNSSNLPINANNKCTLTKRGVSGTSGTYTFSPSGEYIWLATPTQINSITWNGNLLTEGVNEDYTYKGSQTIKLDTDATTTYYFYMMNGTKTGTYTYVIN